MHSITQDWIESFRNINPSVVSTQEEPLDGYTYCIELFSDLHKDATGCRPGRDFWDWAHQATPDQLQQCWDELVNEL